MATRPPEVTAQAVPFTRANSQAAFAHVIGTTIGDADHHITWAMTRYGVNDLEGLLTTPVGDLETLQFVDPTGGPGGNAPGPVTDLAPAKRNLLKAFLSLHADYSRDLGAAIDVTLVTNNHYNEYRVSGYDHTIPIVPFAGALPAPPAPQVQQNYTPQETFQKALGKSYKNYPKFINDDAWHSFYRKFVTAANMEQMGNVLDPAYVPGTQEEQDLFESQCNYMMLVFEQTLDTNVSKNMLRVHFNTRYGAQLVWRDLLQWARTSVTAEMTQDELRQYLTTARLTSEFPGTYKDWCIKWQDTHQKYVQQLPQGTAAPPDADLS